ncbi:hypothetical protein FOB83_15630 [Cupriavidus metallidurans]|nr:hypothetical protein FOB83_15630 [Cupriavidus metallidurans]
MSNWLGAGEQFCHTALAMSCGTYRRHMATAQKREHIAAQLKEIPEKSDRQVAKALGVSHHTVSEERAALGAGGQIAHQPTRTGTKSRLVGDIVRVLELVQVISMGFGLAVSLRPINLYSLADDAVTALTGRGGTTPLLGYLVTQAGFAGQLVKVDVATTPCGCGGKIIAIGGVGSRYSRCQQQGEKGVCHSSILR